MSFSSESALDIHKPTLTFSGTRAIVFQTFIIGAAVILPAAAHLSGVSVRLLLPMHWPVLLSGLVYGWRAGLLTGLLAPAVNYLMTGYPLPLILPSMTVELLTYGLVSGLLRENVRWNPFGSVAVAVIAGRTVFALSVIVGSVVPGNLAEYFIAALIPGIGAAILQIALLPIAAQWWITQQRDDSSN